MSRKPDTSRVPKLAPILLKKPHTDRYPHVLIHGPDATVTDGAVLVTVPHNIRGVPDEFRGTVTGADWAVLEKASSPTHFENGVFRWNSSMAVTADVQGAIGFPDRAEVEPQGDPVVTVCLDVAMLTKIAAAFGTDRVRIEIRDPKKALVISPIESQNGSALLMPVWLDA